MPTVREVQAEHKAHHREHPERVPVRESVAQAPSTAVRGTVTRSGGQAVHEARQADKHDRGGERPNRGLGPGRTGADRAEEHEREQVKERAVELEQARSLGRGRRARAPAARVAGLDTRRCEGTTEPSDSDARVTRARYRHP